MNPEADRPLDGAFSALLAAFDEALAAGQPPPAIEEEALPEDLRAPLRRARAALALLAEDRLGPPHPDAATLPLPATPCSFDAGTGTGRLGRFLLRREIGRGGQGIVFLAFDPSLGREVALKVPRPEVLVEPELRARFVREAQAAAALDHPHVVPVYETGEAGGICYIASAYCDGPNLAGWLRERSGPAPPRAAAALVAALAEAVHYTHSRGIVHRDLKPSNVLLTRPTPRDPCPAGAEEAGLEGLVPRLTDFGLSKLLEGDETHTRTGVVLGTLPYLAPEQAEGRLREVGPATDVYALGVILYEVLTGRPPFHGGGHLELLRQVATADPPRPGRLRPGLPRDLEAVCLRCLEKDPGRRYPTAAALAEDLRRFLAGEPVRARAPSLWRRGRAWVRSRPLLAGCAVVLSLLALLSAGLVRAPRPASPARTFERAARPPEERERLAQAQQRQYAAGLRLAADLWKEGQVGALGQALDRERPGPGLEDWRGFEWRYLWDQAQTIAELPGHRSPVFAVGPAAAGAQWVSVSHDGAVKVRGVRSREGGDGWSLGHRVWCETVALSAAGLRLVAAPGSCEAALCRVTLWDVATRQPLADSSWPTKEVFCVTVSPDGRMVAVGGYRAGGRGVVQLWEPEAGRKRVLWSLPSGDVPNSSVHALRFSPDGLTLAVGYDHGKSAAIQLLDVATGKEEVSLPSQGITSCLAFSPDGLALVCGDYGGAVRLWDRRAGTLKHDLGRLSDRVLAVAFSGGVVAASSAAAADGQRPRCLGLWDAASGAPLPVDPRLERGVPALAFSPDSKTLALGGGDAVLRLWQPAGKPACETLPGHGTAEAWSVAFSADSLTLASAGDDGLVRLWEAATGREHAPLKGHGSLVSCIAFAPGGAVAVSGSFDRTLRVWDLATGKERRTLAGHTQDIRCLAVAPDGRTLASGSGTYDASQPGELILWDLATGKQAARVPGHQGKLRALAFTPDGRSLASGSEDGTVKLWDLARQEVRVTLRDGAQVWCLAFAPDGKRLATGNAEGVVRLWEAAGGKELSRLQGHNGGVKAVTFSPDGRTLASGSEDGTIKLWQPATGTELLTLRGHRPFVNALAFSPDGNVLASAGHDGAVNLWRAAPKAESRDP